MMLHPSYTELIEVANENVLEGEEPVVRSRYSIIHAAAKRAHQLVDGAAPMIEEEEAIKPLSLAVKELAEGGVRIMPQDLPSTTMGEAIYEAGILGASDTELIGGEPMIIDPSELVGAPSAEYMDLEDDTIEE